MNKKSSMFYGVLVAITLPLLGGCTALSKSNYSTSNALPQVTAPSPLEIISQESQKAMNAQMMLVKYRQDYNNVVNMNTADFSTDKIKVDYIGTPEGVLNSIAIKYGYRFLQQGVHTDLPTVNFTNYYATPEDIVIATDSQLQHTASISLDKQNKTIILIYK